MSEQFVVVTKKGERVHTTLGNGIVVGFESFTNGKSNPLSDEVLSVFGYGRVCVELDDKHAWFFSSVYGLNPYFYQHELEVIDNADL